MASTYYTVPRTLLNNNNFTKRCSILQHGRPHFVTMDDDELRVSIISVSAFSNRWWTINTFSIHPWLKRAVQGDEMWADVIYCTLSLTMNTLRNWDRTMLSCSVLSNDKLSPSDTENHIRYNKTAVWDCTSVSMPLVCCLEQRPPFYIMCAAMANTHPIIGCDGPSIYYLLMVGLPICSYTIARKMLRKAFVTAQMFVMAQMKEPTSELRWALSLARGTGPPLLETPNLGCLHIADHQTDRRSLLEYHRPL